MAATTSRHTSRVYPRTRTKTGAASAAPARSDRSFSVLSILVYVGIIVLLGGIIATPLLVGYAIPVIRNARQKTAELDRQRDELIRARRERQRMFTASESAGQSVVDLGQTVMLDGLRIIPQRVRMHKSTSGDQKEQSFLILELRVENHMPARTVILKNCWQNATLTDNHGAVLPALFPNTLDQMNLSQRLPVSRLSAGNISQEQILFPLPAAAATHFVVTVDPGFYELTTDSQMLRQISTDRLVIQFERTQIQP